MRMATCVRGIFIVALLAFSAGVISDETDSLRLFYEPLTAKPVVSPPPDNQSPDIQPPRLPPNRPVGPSYQYNGFISSDGGIHYFVNGTRLSNLTSVELFSISDSGRTITLRATNGYVFSIAIGETKSATPAPGLERKE